MFIIFWLATIYIFIRLWVCPDVKLKWKIILTLGTFILGYTVPYHIGGAVGLIAIILVLHWHGEEIR